jgi:hypothetical protein
MQLQFLGRVGARIGKLEPGRPLLVPLQRMPMHFVSDPYLAHRTRPLEGFQDVMDDSAKIDKVRRPTDATLCIRALPAGSYGAIS